MLGRLKRLFRPEGYREVMLRAIRRHINVPDLENKIESHSDAKGLFEQALKEQARHAKHMGVGAVVAVGSAVAASALAVPAFPIALALAAVGTGGGVAYTLYHAIRGISKRLNYARQIAELLRSHDEEVLR